MGVSLATDISERLKRGLTRRRFVGGTAATAAVAATAAALSGCADVSSDGSALTYSGESQVIDDTQVVDVTDEYEYVDDTGLSALYTWSLPLGTVLFHCEGSWAAAMFAPESAVNVNTLGVVSLATGTATTLLTDPLLGSGYAFHDVRCGSGVFAWVEEDYAAATWTLYGQCFSAGLLTGSPVELDSGDEDWEPAKFTCTGSSVIWQKMPFASGAERTSYSHCYRWTVDATASEELYESPGRFATSPRVTDGILTIAPRVLEDEGTYYGMTAIDLDTLATLDQLVMPSSVKPFEAIYMNNLFVFAVEANYGYGGSLGNMGSYIGREGSTYITLSREPLAWAVGDGGSRYFIKVKSSHYVVDTEAETYSVLTAPSDSLDYGDYPASEGLCTLFATYSTIRGDDGSPASVTLRVFDLTAASEAEDEDEADEEAEASDEESSDE